MKKTAHMGYVHKYGDDVNTDEIIPARYLYTTNAKELAGHCMEDLDPDFRKKVKPGDVIVAGKNFGCGSSREHAPIAIRASGISCVIAQSFSRIFFRNSVNIGLPIIETGEAARALKSGSRVEVDVASGVVRDMSEGKSYIVEKYPPFMQKIINAGGLMGYVKKRIKR